MKFWISVVVLCLATANLQADERKITRQMKEEQRVALVIGNNNYQGDLSTLKNPVNDAISMRNILEKRGFDVIFAKNATKKVMAKKLKKFYQEIGKGGIGLFFFAGHGMEVENSNYLIPTDAKLKEKDDAEFDAIALNRITKKMLKARNRLNIVVLDACRNNPFDRGGEGGLATISPPRGMFISYSTEAGKTASDNRSGNNGLYTKYLIQNIQKPLNIYDVFKQTQEDVHDNTGGKQFPAIYDKTIRGKFYFTLPKTTPVPDPEPIYEPVVKSDKWVVVDGLMYQNQPFNIQDKENYDNQQNGGRVWEWKKFFGKDAFDYCTNLTLYGYNNWRLPTRKELKKLLIPNSLDSHYFIKKEFLKNMPPLSKKYKFATFWTSTLKDSSYAWYVRFDNGYDNWNLKISKNYVLCVRGQ